MLPHLQIQRVTKAFESAAGRSVAIRGIDLEIERGEFVALIGHSGCGKSTLLNIVAGLTMPTEGQVLLDDRPVRGPGPDRGMVFQNYSLLPWCSVWQNVLEAVDAVYANHMLRREKQEITEQYLRMVGLWEHRQKRPNELSGGMKQRVAIARAFAIRPKVLLLDEPFGALDALTKASLHEELMKLWSSESETETVVMVTHDVDEAIYLSDRVVVMTNGPAATIAEVLAVPISRPRDKRALLHDPKAVALKERLLNLLGSLHP
jgi:nitrate ABC transporter ATP-binding subunit